MTKTIKTASDQWYELQGNDWVPVSWDNDPERWGTPHKSNNRVKPTWRMVGVALAVGLFAGIWLQYGIGTQRVEQQPAACPVYNYLCK